MTNLEIRILTALKEHSERMDAFDKECEAEAQASREEAEIQTSEYWKKDCLRHAEWHLSFQHHGYDFIEAWKNTIAKVMYNRVYSEWHSAQAGRRKGQGHGAYITSELTADERSKVSKVFENMVKKGYFRISKSGAKAKFIER